MRDMPVHPLRSALRCGAQLVPNVSVGSVPHGVVPLGWVDVEAEVAATCTAIGDDPGPAAVITANRWIAPLSAITNALAIMRRAPMRIDDSTLFVASRDGVTGQSALAVLDPTFVCLPVDVACRHDDARVVQVDELVDRTVAALLDRIVEPFLDRLAQASGLAVSALWGVTAWHLVGALTNWANHAGRSSEIRRRAGEILAADLRLARAAPCMFTIATVAGSVLVTGGDSCCLAYRWIEGRRKCAGCPMRSRESQVREYERAYARTITATTGS